MKSKNTKRALVMSAVALLLCAAMLAGATFAWFTDTASTGVNKIVSGNLNVGLVDQNGQSIEGATLNFVKADGSEKILWEPGCTYELPKIYVKNDGNLALKYKIVISGIKGSAQLNNVIDWTINDADLGPIITSAQTRPPSPSPLRGICRETAGNDYMNKTIDGISVTVYATQDTVESDSYNNTYDENAEYDKKTVFSVDTVDALKAAAENAKAGDEIGFRTILH